MLASCVLAAMLAVPAVAVVDISVTDGAMALLAADVSASDLGPVFYSTTDGFTFATATTDQATAWYAEIAKATNDTGAQSATIQGTSHTFADWYYAMESGSSRFSDVNMTGTFDSDAAAYSVPLLFAKDAQGTLVTTYYDSSSPPDGGVSQTFYWAYDSGDNRYVVGASKDLSLETELAPLAAGGELVYAKALHGNTYLITGNAGAPNYEPTLMQGKYTPLLNLPGSKTWFVLMDTPDGVHNATYQHTFRVTTQAT